MRTKTYDDLTQVPLDKLYKLRDVANDNLADLQKECADAEKRWLDIIEEIQKRYSQTTD